MSLRWIIIAVVVLVALAYVGKKWVGEEVIVATENVGTLNVTVLHPTMQTIEDMLSVTGITVAREEVIVASELTGVRVQRVLVDVGNVVAQGQALAILDVENQKHHLTQMQSNYDRARDEFSRIDAIKNTGAVSRESVVQKRTLMDSAQAQLSDATMNVRRGTVVAPTAGIVFERNAKIGSMMDASTPLYRIARNGEIELEAHVPESDIVKLKLNQIVRISVSGHAVPFNGHIRLITPRIDPAKRTAMIRIAIENGELSLPVGLFADASITAGEINGMVISTGALQEDTSGTFVWQVDENDKVQRLAVNVLFRSNDNVVVDGLTEEVRIVAQAGAFVKDGDHVTISASEAK